MSTFRKEARAGLVTVVYECYVKHGWCIVEVGKTYWIPAREAFAHRKHKKTRDTARRRDKLKGTKNWDDIYDSMRKDGFDPNQPLVFDIKKGEKCRLSHGHHRIAVASELGITVVAVQFRYM